MFLPNLNLNKIEEFKNFSINDVLEKEYVLPADGDFINESLKGFYTINIVNGSVKNLSDEFIAIEDNSVKEKESFNPFLSLNRDYNEKLTNIIFKKNPGLPVLINNLYTQEGTFTASNITITVSGDLKLDIVEKNSSCHRDILVNNNRELNIKSANVNYYRIDDILDTNALIYSYTGEIDNGKLNFIGYNFNGELNLNIWDIDLISNNASCFVDGVIKIKNRDRVGSICKINHKAPETYSSQEFRHILDGNSYAMYDGDSTVLNIAKESVTSQKSKTIMLSDGSRILNKPRLNVFTGEVKATHGATVGKLNAEDIFYLKQRGFKDSVINQILVNAFLIDIFDKIEQEDIKGLFYDKR